MKLISPSIFPPNHDNIRTKNRPHHRELRPQTPYALNYLSVLNLSPLHVYFTFYRLARYILSCQFLFFSLENDDMESSKRSVKLLSLIFIIRCSFMSTCKSLVAECR